MFEAAIPGQSLTTTPKNAPYERPPQIADPSEAIAFHLNHLTDETKMDAVMQLLEKGVDVKTLTEGILRGAVAGGIHSVDVSLIVAPVIHEYIKSTANVLGVDYTEGLEDEDAELSQEQAGKLSAASKLDEILRSESPKREEPVVMVEEPVPEGKPRGLMERSQ